MTKRTMVSYMPRSREMSSADIEMCNDRYKEIRIIVMLKLQRRKFAK